MFTGIIQEIGVVSHIKETRGREITIKAKNILKNIHYGDSISVNGTCQTVTAFDDNSFTFFSMIETLEITNLSKIKIGSRVNLETSLTLNSFLGGHLIMGHIDGLGKIQSINRNQNSTIYSIKVDNSLIKYIVNKGSIAIDGISLTVYGINKDIVSVAIIPTTSKDTTLSSKNVGDVVNIETDLMAKYVENILYHKEKLVNNTENTKNNKGISEDVLKKYGYI